MELWKFIQQKLAAGKNIMLLYVLESEGSSPGRQGFKMAVADDGEFSGTIGGGIMEHKLVEKAKMLLQKNEQKTLLLRQHHDKEHGKDHSGMICSGSQLNAFTPLSATDEKTVEKIIASEKKSIFISPEGLSLGNEHTFGLQYKTDTDWFYSEAIEQQPVIHIIGGGHVGLALSELMKYLGFYIKLYDDRPDLNTISVNSFADEKYTISYESIGDQIPDAASDFVVIMTMGYRTDKIVVKQLLQKSFYYLGMMGSEKKISTLITELVAEGINEDQLKRIHTPIGINILSKTAREISISIAAEIIREKNKDLPTGRK